MAVIVNRKIERSDGNFMQMARKLTYVYALSVFMIGVLQLQPWGTSGPLTDFVSTKVLGLKSIFLKGSLIIRTPY